MDGLKEFSWDLELQGRAKVSRDCTVWAVRRYQTWALDHGADPEGGRKEDLIAYLGHLRARGLKHGALKNDFSALSAWFSFLVESGQLDQNPIPALRKRYLQNYKDEVRQRQLISVEDAAKIVNATIASRDRAILLLFLKTGIRRNELISLDLQDVDLPGQSITLKPTGKRSNRTVFFDDEAGRALSRWLVVRKAIYKKRGEEALFISNKGMRLQASAVDALVRTAAERVGLHDHSSEKLEDRFGPHCCRHWFTTHLRRAGMPREFIQELRGDVRREAIDIYDHIDREELRRSYLAHIPRLGI